MIKYRSGMQNGVQIVNIFIKAAVWIGHIILLHSFRFGTQNDLEKRKACFKTALKKILNGHFQPPRAGTALAAPGRRRMVAMHLASLIPTGNPCL